MMNEPTKQTGILWKLNEEEKEALREVCQMADSYCSLVFLRPDSERRMKIRQLLGEETE